MSDSTRRPSSWLPRLAAVLFVSLGGWALGACTYTPTQIHDGRLEQRSILVWGWTVGNRVDADAVYDELEAMHANVVYLLVYYHGAYYRTANPDIRSTGDVTADFDPLGYAVDSLHARGIQVFAMLALGEQSPTDPVLVHHPDWRAPGPAGQSYAAQEGWAVDWLDLGNPATQPFLASVASEVARDYAVDGVLLTYLGYPSRFGFSSYHRQQFAIATGGDSVRLTAESLPAVLIAEGNTLATPTTGKVLVSFSNGSPAVILNSPDGGATVGESVLFNWQAQDGQMPVSDALLRNAITYLNKSNLVLLDSPAEPYQQTLYWLTRLGFAAASIGLADLATQCAAGNSLVVIPKVYAWTETDAQTLEQCFTDGNAVIYLDGPTSAVSDPVVGPHLQTVLGMSSAGPYLHAAVYTIHADQPLHPIVPPTENATPESALLELWSSWTSYLRDTVTECMHGISGEFRTAHPGEYLGATVSPSLQRSRAFSADWDLWYAADLFDFYLTLSESKTSLTTYQAGVADQKSVDPDLSRIFPGICAYPEGLSTTELTNLVSEARASDSRVIFFYRYEDMSTEKKELIGRSLWPDVVPPYWPELISP